MEGFRLLTRTPPDCSTKLMTDHGLQPGQTIRIVPVSGTGPVDITVADYDQQIGSVGGAGALASIFIPK